MPDGVQGRGSAWGIGLDDSSGQDDPAVITGYKAARNRPVTRSQKQVNQLIAAVRAPVEHALAYLKNWRVLTKLRFDPRWATALVRALMVLTHREVARRPMIMAADFRPRPARASRYPRTPES
ncbi:transposase family protein [Streptomyces sp. NPDC002205]|uniref:transposase family protein n=1 Tax=Streptomyces sp. NPDC002205 TaxID=3154411 RepID=UPI003323D17C